MCCGFFWSADDTLCVVRNCTVAVFLIFSLAKSIVYSRWPCTFCIDIHEVDGLLSAWAKACWLCVCACVLLASLCLSCESVCVCV